MRCNTAEKLLEKEQFAFEFRSAVPIAKIDLVGARINPARLDRSVDKKRVEAMFIDMVDAGSTDNFPAIIVLDNGPGLFELVTGLHRLEAAIAAELDTFDCYVVLEPTLYRRMLLPRLANVREGQSPSEDDKLKMVFQVLDEHPHARIEDLAKLFLLSDKTVRNALIREKVAYHARSLGVYQVYKTEIEPKGERAIAAFSKVKNDVLFIEAMRIIGAYRCNVAEIQAIARRAEDATTEHGGMASLQEAEDDLAQRDQEARAVSKGRGSLATPTKYRRYAVAMINMGSAKRMGFDAIPENAVPGTRILFEQLKEQLCEGIALLTAREEMANRIRARVAAHRPGAQPSTGASPAP